MIGIYLYFKYNKLKYFQKCLTKWSFVLDGDSGKVLPVQQNKIQGVFHKIKSQFV